MIHEILAKIEKEDRVAHSRENHCRTFADIALRMSHSMNGDEKILDVIDRYTLLEDACVTISKHGTVVIDGYCVGDILKVSEKEFPSKQARLDAQSDSRCYLPITKLQFCGAKRNFVTYQYDFDHTPISYSSSGWNSMA